MEFRARVILLLVGVLCSVHFTSASDSFSMDLLLSKFDFLQGKLQDIEKNFKMKEQSCQNTSTEVPIVKQDDGLQRDGLDKLERALKEIERANKKLLEFETTFKAMDNTLKEVQSEMKGTYRTVKGLDETTLAREVSLQEVARIEQLDNKLIAKGNSAHELTLDIMGNLQNGTNKVTDLPGEFSKNQSNMEDGTAYSSCRLVPKELGYYNIHVAPGQFVKVYCEQASLGGGWILFQRRYNGEVDFFRNWTDYRDGFGNIEGEFWLGLKYLHMLTSTRKYEMLVELTDFEGNYGYAKYAEFKIGNEAEGFKLKVARYSGTAGDSLGWHNNMKFSTKDRDNDNFSTKHCAELCHGGWWYNRCSQSNLNGLYQNEANNEKTIHWLRFKSHYRGMASAKMMLREVV